MVRSYNPLEIEPEILEFWIENKIWEQARDKNKGKKTFYFLQGPPYTSGRLHMGHAWNNSSKDFVLRYKRMAGFDVWDRAGYDMHGLPTAHKVMAKHGFKDKHDIEKYGLDKFAKECMEWSTEKAKVMDDDLRRLGIWMDYDNAYYPITTTYMEGEWWLIKKAHENNRLYEGLRTLSWCASCQTALAKHEQEYEEVTDKSIFLKFPVKGKQKEFLVIWTTTPWTIPFNLGIMVHPELDYVKAKVKDEFWILAKGLAAPVVQSFTDEMLNIVEEFKGAELEGMEYVHPLETEIKAYAEMKKEHPKLHTVVLSNEYVDLSAGTGLVHMAPGCGPEDYEVGHRNNIPPYNTLKENGVFDDTMGKFSGWTAKKDDHKFIEELEKTGYLIAVTDVEHDYAHCERCHNPIVYRTTKQWFFKVEDVKDELVKANEEIAWVPDAGKNAMRGWLEHLRDNSITKQRFWGTPVPIWRCECGHYDVIGSVQELKDKAGKVPEDLHKPWIDEITIPCDKCGKQMNRIPDILDVWIDAGTASWNCLDYPKRDDWFNKWWPADFILEAKEQVRGWFNMLMVASMVAMNKPISFKACYMHGMLTDVEGVKMSKSLGNVISPYEIIDRHGADTLRTYVCATPAGEDINFSWDEAKLKHRNLTILWNVHKYLLDLANELGKNPFTLTPDLGLEEKFILSRLHSTIKRQTEIFDKYLIDLAPGCAEALFLELSRTYIKLVRDKASLGTEKEKEAVLSAIANVLIDLLKIFAPVAPFITEAIYQNLRKRFDLKVQSIHLWQWPKYDESMIDVELEASMNISQVIIQAVLALRDKAQIGLRWPLNEVVISTENDDVKQAIDELGEIIKVQTNVKNVLVNRLQGVVEKVKPDFAKIQPEFKEKAAQIIAHLTTTSTESILKHIKENGAYTFDVEGEKVSIKQDHLITIREVPAPYNDIDFRFGTIYLNIEQDEDLLAEGFARELMRRVQELRKKAGLSKSDKVKLMVDAGDLKNAFEKHAELIKEKCGAVSLDFGAVGFANKVKEKVKGKEFEIGVEKV
ncbi:isoleucine--tRNA ligase [Candidatus Woesearchaeota archaeon]|nr:isoleucine--tRNA ligase [Candidatus Woesearchaeota archaeon]MBW3022356.1 isoleucine--tRNA ligase [Candidatus Woesearchaeota archaeon]